MKKFIVLLICLILAGCSFTRSMTIKAGAKGAKAKVYGQLDAGEMVYSSTTRITIGTTK